MDDDSEAEPVELVDHIKWLQFYSDKGKLQTSSVHTDKVEDP